MELTLSISLPTLFLLVQGVGMLFLALALGALYWYRRQGTLGFWAVSWAFAGLGFLLSGLSSIFIASRAFSPSSGVAQWLQATASLCGWCHVALWLLSLRPFLTQRTAPAFPWWSWFVLIGAAGFGVVTGHAAISPLSNVPLQIALIVAYLGGAAVLWRSAPAPRRPSTRLLVAALALHSLIHVSLVHHVLAVADSIPLSRATSDLVVQFLVAGALLVFVLDRDRTELQETVEKLEESEEQFRLIFEHSGVGMALLTPEGHFVRVNPAFVRMLGYQEDELHGRRLRDLVYHQDLSREVRPVRPVDETPLLYEREKRYVRKDGESIWARVLKVPIRDAGGRTRHFVGVLVDITERKKAEDALAASEKRYRQLNQVARDGIHTTNEHGEFLDVNPALCQMLGYDRDELTRMSLDQLALDPSGTREHRGRVLRLGGDRTVVRLRRKDGKILDVELSGALLDLEGRRFWHEISRDVTEQRRAEEALQDAQARLREERDFSKQVLETADTIIVVIDPHGRVLSFNCTAAAVSGYRKEEILGKVVWDVLLPERDVEEARERFYTLVNASDQGSATAAGETSSPAPLMLSESHWRTRAGEERLIAWRNSIVRDDRGKVRYVISAGLDVTDQRRLEEQLRQARKMETLGALVGGIAHDFNNQLTAVLGHLNMVLDDLGRLQEELPDLYIQREHLRDAELGAQRCADITQRLLTFCQGKMGASQVVSVSALLSETEKTLQHEFPSAIHLHFPRVNGLWPVFGDSTQLQQVLLSLAVNASEAMPYGGSLTVSASNRELTDADCALAVEARPGRFVELVVADTGSGMTPEVMAHLFEPFFTTKGSGQGAGMGLAMAYGIVKAHKGWFAVESVPGEGSTFRIFLPVCEAATPRTVKGPKQAVEGGQECVLVVDDEDLVRGLAQAVLERWGFRVLTAVDGEEALSVFRARHADIDLVLLDYSMPNMTGLQVIEKMKEIDPRVCVVFSSGYTMDSDTDQLLATGAKAFLAKPYRPDDLIRVVRAVLDRDRKNIETSSAGQ